MTRSQAAEAMAEALRAWRAARETAAQNPSAMLSSRISTGEAAAIMDALFASEDALTDALSAYEAAETPTAAPGMTPEVRAAALEANQFNCEDQRRGSLRACCNKEPDVRRWCYGCVGRLLGSALLAAAPTKETPQ